MSNKQKKTTKTNTIMSNYSERVSNLLAENQLTIVDFCKKLGLNSQTTISKIVSQNRKPSSKTFGRILKAFPEIKYQWLINGEGDMYKSNHKSTTIKDSDDLTLTSQQIYCKLDEDTKMYKDMLSNKLRDDRDYYDNDSRHSKDIRMILEGFKTLESKVEHYAVQASSSVIEKITKATDLQNKLLIDSLTKIKHLETDLDDIKTFMAANFELDKMNKKKSKQIKKLIPR